MSATIEIMDAITNDDGRLIVTVRVWNTGFGITEFEGVINLTEPGTNYGEITLRGSAGAGSDAFEHTYFIDTAPNTPDEALLTAVLTNGEQEQMTVSFTNPVEIVDCSVGTEYDTMDVYFSADGPDLEPFTTRILVDGEVVAENDWNLGWSNPTDYARFIDADDLPVGEDMDVVVEVV